MTIIFDGTNGITSPGGDTSNTSHSTPIVRSPSSLTLQTNGSTTAVTIDTSQNVGIGTSSPPSDTNLTVLGNFQTGFYRNVTSGARGYFLNIGAKTSGGFADGAYVFGAVDSGDATGYLTFGTRSGGSTGERMRIDSSGNVGIGVTPSAWSAYKGLNIGLNTTLAGSTSGSVGLLSTNAYFDGSSYKYITTDAATQYQQNTGQHIWRGAASGTAGNTLTFTQILALERTKSLALEGASSQSGTGITFPATQSASSDANTLDDYEEGTWTPAVNSGFTSPAYSVRAGTYTKVGNVVTFTLRIDMSSSSRAGSVIQFSLPFTSKNSTTAHNGGGASWAYLYEAIGNSTTTNVPMLYINNNAATMDCYSTTGSAFLGTDLSTANPYFYIGGSYLTA